MRGVDLTPRNIVPHKHDMNTTWKYHGWECIKHIVRIEITWNGVEWMKSPPLVFLLVPTELSWSCVGTNHLSIQGCLVLHVLY